MDFEEWFESLDLDNWTNKKYMHDAFEAGQQSKQAEIDHRTQVGAELAGELIRKRAEIDALKDKINKVLYAISQSELHRDRAIWGIQDEIKEILK